MLEGRLDFCVLCLSKSTFAVFKQVVEESRVVSADVAQQLKNRHVQNQGPVSQSRAGPGSCEPIRALIN